MIMNTHLCRRAFLHSTALTLSAGLASASAAEAKRTPVVETHVHCFAGKDDKRFPYHDRAPYRPDASTPQGLVKAMDAAGIDFAIIVHPEPYQDDHRYLEYCLQVEPKRFKGTCLFFADKPDACQQLKALAGKSTDRLASLRVHAYAPDRQPPFGKPELKALWKQAGDLGLAIQLHFEPRYAPGFEPLIKEMKDVRVIIDHLGRPMQGTVEEHDVVVKWGRYPNTIMKLSALPDVNRYPHRDIGPIIKRLTETFGVERLIAGGLVQADTTPERYRAERKRLEGHLLHLTEADRARILGGNSVRLFGLGA